MLTLPLAAVAQATSLQLLFPSLAAAVAALVVSIVVSQRRRLWAAVAVQPVAIPASGSLDLNADVRR
ncbi:MAG: hypothetical protein AB7J35_05145 [Dehalococcoidia bacterium]